MGAGIDYGMGLTNIDLENGIRYGVIPQNSGILQAWADSSEPIYPETEEGEEENDYCDCVEPLGFALDDSEYLAECWDSGDVFVLRSPYYTCARFCSPCAPGACYLLNPDIEGAKAYCFGADFFDSCDPCPYPIYRVDDDSLVYTPSKE